MQKICLITGANSGLGKAMAVSLAKQGARVIMVCRHQDKGKEAQDVIKKLSGSHTVDLWIADLSSRASIRRLADTINKKYPKIDVLIHNAGLVLKQRTLSEDGIEMTLATNHLAPFLLTHLLLDLLKQSGAARIIHISSAIHRWGKIDWEDLEFNRRHYRAMRAYAQSKLLLNITAFEWARRLEGLNITINSVHPGAVKTNLGLTDSDNLWIKLFVRILQCFFITPEQAASFPVALATAAAFQTVHGQYFDKGKAANTSRVCYDPVMGKQVWERSLRFVGLPPS